MALAVDVLSPCYNYVKGLFFPIRKKFWLKLGLVSLISTRGGAGGSNFNMSNSVGDIGKVIDFIKKYWLAIVSGLGLLAVFGWLWNIIQNTFSFIFIDSLLSGKVEISDGFNRHIKKGFSLFLFNIIIWLSSLAAFVLLALPLAIPVIKNINDLSWSVISIPYLIFAIIIFIILVFFLKLLNFFVYTFVIIDMYVRDARFISSFKAMFRVAKDELGECLIYLVMNIALGIASFFIAVIIVVLLLVLFIIVAGIFALILILLAKVNNIMMVLSIVIGILLAIFFLLLFVFSLVVISVPIPSFFFYYSYLMVTELKKKNTKKQ